MKKWGMCSGSACRFGAIARRMAYTLAALLLVCASSARAQVIEEGGFPIKSISGESFSLSCPLRLVAQAGETISLSCAATVGSEGGVQYRWEALSGDGLRLLSDAQSHSPFFTAPVSGGREYTYRLTAMASGVYRTSTVTVTVHGDSGETIGAPGLQEECDPLAIPDEPGQGCVPWEGGPDPFGFGPESEGGFLFPEAPGPSDLEGGFDSRAPPRLECPAAVFLEELETGAIECFVSDAAGEEYLEYTWEPVGNTTRDYLDNPRLIPENSPTPSVIAPETPVYETLESFRSGETTFRYRYRLTAASRATGLSSSSEVEVYVSSSRPSVYCPLEVVVEEGGTVTLDCEGVDPLSFRMDYDEEAASVLWEWEGLWGTSTGPLDAADLSSPLFTAPAGSAGKEYHYIASMTTTASGAPRTARRRVTVRIIEAPGAQATADASKDVTATVKNKAEITVTCTGNPYAVEEGDGSITLECSAEGAPDGSSYTYLWEARGSTSGTDDLSATDASSPVFSVPDNVSSNTDYTYTLTASAENAEDGLAQVTVTVYNVTSQLRIICTGSGASYSLEGSNATRFSDVYEGDGDVTINCNAYQVPAADISWRWTPSGSTTDTDLLSATNTGNPTFSVPPSLDEDTEYVYEVFADALGASGDDYLIYVEVEDKPDIEVTCSGSPYKAYEGNDDIGLECMATGAPSGSPYAYVWTARGDTQDTALLKGTDGPTPTFAVPDEVDEDETYEYTLTVSADNAKNGAANVTVTVHYKPEIMIVCEDKEVDEGSEDIELSCMASGAPGNDPDYEWSWAPTVNLTDSDTGTPVFAVPYYVDRDTTWTYTATATADNAKDGAAEVNVAVKNVNLADPLVTCVDIEVYEGADDIELDCSVENEPTGAAYSWAAISPTANTDLLIANTDSLRPTFAVPDNVVSIPRNRLDISRDYKYEVSLLVGGRVVRTENVVVTVTEKDIRCWSNSGPITKGPFMGAVEGGNGVVLRTCRQITGAGPFSYSWQELHHNLKYVSNPNEYRPVFTPPDDVSRVESHTYLLTISSPNAGSTDVFSGVWVSDTELTCNNPDPVYEGSADFDLDCSIYINSRGSGIPNRTVLDVPGYSYTWSARDDTPDTGLLIAGVDGMTPTFAVPENVDADTDYEYRLTLFGVRGTILHEGDVTVTVKNKPTITCTDSEAYEGAPDITLNCSAENDLPDATYAWAARGSTSDISLLTGGTDSLSPTFDVPPNIDIVTGSYPVWGGSTRPKRSDKDYEYRVTLSASGIDNVTVTVTADVTVTVKEKPDIGYCGPGWYPFGWFGIFTNPNKLREGDSWKRLDCGGSPTIYYNDYYRFVGEDHVTSSWTAAGGTPNDLLTEPNTLKPYFKTPADVEGDTVYEYTLRLSRENHDTSESRVFIVVRDLDVALSVACMENNYSVYEGAADFDLDCEATGKPEDSEYDYVWTGRGSTVVPGKLSSVTIAKPRFDVPEEVSSDETYEYRLTVTADDAEPDSADITVTVLNKPPLTLICTPPAPVYEGAPDFNLDCSASGAPAGSTITYAWTARGDTSDTALLTDTNGPTPTFAVPETVDADTDYEYTLTVSAENAEDATANVTVRVLDKKPLDVVCATPSPAYEGSDDFALDCAASGTPAGSVPGYVWTARGETPDTALLIAGTDGPSPTFDVPDEVDEDETYEYLLTVSAENAEDGTAEVTVKVLKLGSIALVCASPPLVYEGAEDFALDCSISGDTGDSDYTYAWTARGETPDTSLLSATDIPSPTFAVPDALDATTTYEYLLTASEETVEDASAEVTVTVLNKGALSIVCTSPAPVYEGSEDIALDCSASGAPAGSAYAYAWTAQGDTQDTALLASGTDGPTPTFAVPGAVASTTTYEYLLTVSAANAEDGSAQVTVTVLNRGSLRVVCADPPSVYEGSEDIAFDCEASGAPAGSAYAYAWTAQGDTQDTALLASGTDGPTPTFAVPGAVASTTTYEYLLTVSAANAEDGSAQVTVTVLNRGSLRVVCADPPSVYEGSEDIALDCSASGAPAGSAYAYAWTARGNMQDVSLLSRADIASPTFLVPDEVAATTKYEYLLTASAANAESGSAQVTVTVLNTGALLVVCTDPGSVYEGSADIAFDCEASGAPAGSAYDYVWTARGDTPDTSLLSETDIDSPTFYVPDAIDVTTKYEYLLTASAANAEFGSAQVTVTVLNTGALLVVCTDPGSVYEGSADIAFDCEASGAPAGSAYDYVWTARGDTPDTSLLSATDIDSPTFYVPDAIDVTTTYEYLLTVSAANAESGSAEVTVTVLDKPVLAVVCADPGSVYEGSEDIAFDCSASGAPAGSDYRYVWEARGDTQDTSLLSETDIASPTFYVPDEVDEDETYEYLLTVSAENAEDGTAEVVVTVLDRAVVPPSEPVSPPVEEPPVDSPPAPPVASSSSTRAPSDPTALSVTVSASPLRFGVQSADTQVYLDPTTDRITTQISGPYHAGRMTLAPGGGEEFDENGEMDLSIELASPVVLKRADAIEASSLVLTPNWSYAESCEQLSSQTIGGLYTEVTLSEDTCRLLRFGGEVDLTDAPSGQYTGSLDLVLRSGEREETFAVEVSVTVLPAQRVITIGPGGVRFGTSRELPVRLTEEQNLSIYPDMAFMTEGKPDGVFELSNPSLIPLEVSVSTRFGYTEATETGREIVVEDVADSDLGDLSEVVDIHPGVLVLMPGEKGLVRYGLKEEAHSALAEKGYAAFFDVVSTPRRYADLDRMPEEVTGDRTARVTMRVTGGVRTWGRGVAATRYAVVGLVCGSDVRDVPGRDAGSSVCGRGGGVRRRRS